MVKKIFLVCVAMLLNSWVSADMEILLKDGSKIVGEIKSMENGVYKIQSRSMGSMEVGASQVQNIRSTSSSSSSNNIAITNATIGSPAVSDNSQNIDASSRAAMASIQTNIANNPGMMASIMSLRDDPQMRAVLADPEVMQAIRSFDFTALANNPKIRALMDNPKVKRISGSVQ